MYYKDIQHLKEGQFQRLVGVKRPVYDQMVAVVSAHRECHRKHPSRGRATRLSIADQVLVMLMYYREYRTFFHVGVSYGLSETQCWRIVTNTEAILLASELFHLPGKKKLTGGGVLSEVVIVDVSESPIERPKKNNVSIIQVKRKDIP
jgi:hypothetical protein